MEIRTQRRIKEEFTFNIRTKHILDNIQLVYKYICVYN